MRRVWVLLLYVNADRVAIFRQQAQHVGKVPVGAWHSISDPGASGRLHRDSYDGTYLAFSRLSRQEPVGEGQENGQALPDHGPSRRRYPVKPSRQSCRGQRAPIRRRRTARGKSGCSTGIGNSLRAVKRRPGASCYVRTRWPAVERQD